MKARWGDTALAAGAEAAGAEAAGRARAGAANARPAASGSPADGRQTPDGAEVARAEGVEVRFPGARPALSGIDLRLRRGELVGVLGPNGSGKSTLLRVLATLLRPSAGTVTLVGRPARRPDRRLLRRIGYAGHEAVHFEDLTGRENAVFFARAAGVPADEAAARVDALLERVGLLPAASRPVRTYSHGMRRKLLLVEALAHGPDLVLLDETDGPLDPSSREDVYTLLRERCAAGAAVLLATHAPEDAGRHCGRVLFLHRGRVVLEGEPGRLLAGVRLHTRIEVDTRPRRIPGLRPPPGELEETPDGFALRTPEAAGRVLPQVCARVHAAGGEVLALRVEPPGLRDLFTAATGETWRR